MPTLALAGFAACLLLIAAGVALYSLPAGLIAAGALGLPLVYAWQYLAVRVVRKPADPRPGATP